MIFQLLILRILAEYLQNLLINFFMFARVSSLWQPSWKETVEKLLPVNQKPLILKSKKYTLNRSQFYRQRVRIDLFIFWLKY